MDVSIIIPVYNVAPYIEDCLWCVMCQTYIGPIECLIVDDCGTDESILIAERMIEKYEGPILFKILHHGHNRGLSAARNTGMEKAVGEYIFFIDSDDVITADCLEKMMAVVQDNPEVELVQGTSLRISGENHIYWPEKIKLTHAYTNEAVRRCRYMGKQLNDPAWNKLIKRKQSFTLVH